MTIRLPILAYHNIDRAPAGAMLPRLYVTPEKFDRQMWLLRRLGVRGVSISEGLTALRSGSDRPLAVLTFDDGYADNESNALPILRAYGFTATCYLVSNHLGEHNEWDAAHLKVRKPLMSVAQVESWLAGGMEIGSHTCSHPQLDELDPESAFRELAESRSTLSKRFGVDVQHFCYPFGRYDRSTVEQVRRAGYASAVSTGRGVARSSDDPYQLPRASIHGNTGPLKFFLKAATRYEDRRRPALAS